MYRGIDFLRKKLARKHSRVKLRYQYYEMKNTVQDFGISTPPKLRPVQTHLGWCAKAVDAMADRLQFLAFEDKDDEFEMNEIFDMNSRDVLFDSAILGALIASCSFIYISKDDDGYPRLQVIDGGNATGIIDPITNMLTEGYAILEVTDKRPSIEAYLTAEETVIYRDGQEAEHIPNPANYPLLVPIIYRPDAKRPFGHSRITRACMDIINSASRTAKRSEISAEFYSFPQKYIVGLDEGVEIEDKWSAAMSALIAISKDGDGDKPQMGQFSQQSMTPHLDQLRMYASLFSGETGLTLDDLGFPTENPSSAESIKATHENLRYAARKAQRTFGTGFLNVGYLACSVRDDFPYFRTAVKDIKPTWEPIFEPDSAMLSAIGDGALKVNQAIPGYFGSANLRQLTGIDSNAEG